jgi:hypothetical protein
MSRQNKVNPGMYTQRGRLTQDDAAREIAKQRSVGSEHTWQPVQRDQEPRLTSESEGDDEDAGVAAPDESAEKKPARVTAKPRSAKKTAARKMAKAPARRTVRAKKTAAPAMRGKAKSGRTTKTRATSAKRRKS